MPFARGAGGGGSVGARGGKRGPFTRRRFGVPPGLSSSGLSAAAAAAVVAGLLSPMTPRLLPDEPEPDASPVFSISDLR
ncbi:hypothetical protein N9L68_02855 [bacterium]|nr:hypothetical protein [bacterium]